MEAQSWKQRSLYLKTAPFISRMLIAKPPSVELPFFGDSPPRPGSSHPISTAEPLSIHTFAGDFIPTTAGEVPSLSTLKLVHFPASLAPTLVALPSMSRVPRAPFNF
jgi:hypothetical protein